MDSLKIEVDYSDVETASKHLDRLAEAADRARAALSGLNEEVHGGVTIQMVGDVCQVDILPIEK